MDFISENKELVIVLLFVLVSIVLIVTKRINIKFFAIGNKNNQIDNSSNKTNNERDWMQFTVGSGNTQIIIENLILNHGTNDDKPYVLVIGGANIEYIYEKNDDTKLFTKQNYSDKTVELGGSGLNYTLKLMSTKINVFPILPLGKDSGGEKIKERLDITQTRITKPKFDLKEADILYKDIKTRESLIISEKKGRTIWSNSNDNVSNDIFNQIIDKSITILRETTLPKVVMIGHIHSDRDLSDIEELSTYKLINEYKYRSLLYVNFGRAQLSYGFDFWKDTLRDIDILQFNLEEIKHFFSKTNYKDSLVDILKELQKLNLTVVITLDKLGAICITKDTKSIIYAQELIIDNYKDKTGAGDSFACGIVFNLLKNSNINNLTYNTLRPAIQSGRTWASYTCTHLGGTGCCPDEYELDAFNKKITNNDSNWGTKEIDYDMINLIDKAYSRCQHSSN